MTNNNKFIYFTGAIVEKTKFQNFKITLEEEEAIVYVSATDVNKIQNRVEETEELIALVLAYIEYVFQNTKAMYQRMDRLEQEIIDDNVIVIMSQVSAEEMIDIIKTLKWHEVLQIFEAKNPAQEIRDRI